MKYAKIHRSSVCVFLLQSEHDGQLAWDLARMAVMLDGAEGENFEVRYGRRGPVELLVCGRRHLLRTMYHYLDTMDALEWEDGAPGLHWFAEAP